MNNMVEFLAALLIATALVTLGSYLIFVLEPRAQLECEEYARECQCLVSCTNWFMVIGIVLNTAGVITLVYGLGGKQ